MSGKNWVTRSNLSQVSIVWPSTFQISVSLKPPIEIDFHMEPPSVLRTKLPLSDLGYMSKMATIPIYNRNTSDIFLSRMSGLVTLKRSVQHRRLQPIIVYSYYDAGHIDLFLRGEQLDISSILASPATQVRDLEPLLSCLHLKQHCNID